MIVQDNGWNCKSSSEEFEMVIGGKTWRALVHRTGWHWPGDGASNDTLLSCRDSDGKQLPANWGNLPLSFEKKIEAVGKRLEGKCGCPSHLTRLIHQRCLKLLT